MAKNIDDGKDGRLLNKRETAARLGLGVRGVEGLMSRRALPFHRISARAVRFAEAVCG